MKKHIILFFVLLLNGSLSAQSWQELYDSTGDCWGRDWPTCLEILEQAKIAAEREFTQTDSVYLLTLNELAAVYHQVGNYKRALTLLLELQDIFKEINNPLHSEYASFLNNLARLYQDLGQFEQALPLMREALDLTEQVEGKAHHYYSLQLHNLSLLLSSMKRNEEALPLAREAIQLAENGNAEAQRDFGTYLGNLANIYLELDRTREALPITLQALEHTKRVKGTSHPNYAIRIHNLAYVYLKLGEISKGVSIGEEALQITKAILGEDHPEYAKVLFTLAQLYWFNGDYDQSVERFGAVHDLHRILIEQQFSALSEDLQLKFIRSLMYRIHSFGLFAHTRPQNTDLQTYSYEEQLWLKGLRQSNTTQLLQSLRKQDDPELIQMYQKWEKIHGFMARQYSIPVAFRSPLVDSLEHVAEDLENQLASQSQSFLQERKLAHWTDIKKQLKPNEAIVEYDINYASRNSEDKDSIFYFAYIIRQDYTHPKMVYLCKAKELESLLSPSREQKESRFNKLYSSRGIQPRTQVSNEAPFKDLIWTPFDSLLTGVDRIYLTPAGLLHRINLGAIPYDQTTLLTDQYQLEQLGNSSSLMHQKASYSFSNKDAVLIGGVTYGEELEAEQLENSTIIYAPSSLEDIRISSRGHTSHWQYLPATLTEVQQISKTLTSAGFQTSIFQGQKAKEAILSEMKTSPRILHIATHGYFFPDPYEKQKTTSSNVPSHIELSNHPMIRSGLILANANQAWQGNPVPEGQEDGILTAYEISHMDLSHTELVVLSACETGLGDIEANEGVYGLQRAFKIAGVKYVMMSLWQVPDQATQELMTTFYANWLGGMEIRKALQEAQTQMRKKYKDPYYWAGFVLVE